MYSFLFCLSISLSTRFFFSFLHKHVCMYKYNPKGEGDAKESAILSFDFFFIRGGIVIGFPSTRLKENFRVLIFCWDCTYNKSQQQPAHPANYRNCFHFFIYLLCCTQLGAHVCAVKTSFLARLVICWALRVYSLRALSASSHFFWVAEIRLAMYYGSDVFQDWRHRHQRGNNRSNKSSGNLWIAFHKEQNGPPIFR